jgi:glycosyltransferase involved in cell wall biosynthesis
VEKLGVPTEGLAEEIDPKDAVKPSMKILAISAFHPPDHFGGYELRIKSILDGLTERGHQILLLTNLPQKKGLPPESGRYEVVRRLHNRMKAKFFPSELLEDLLDTRLLEEHLGKFQPDLIYIGHLYVFCKTLLPYLANTNVPIYYDEGGSGLLDAWEDHGRWFRFSGDWRSRFAPINWIKPNAIQLICGLSKGRIQKNWQWPLKLHVTYNSRTSLEIAGKKGVPIENYQVLHSGIDLTHFEFKQRSGIGTTLNIIVPGRLEKRKGQIDAVVLLQELVRRGVDARVILAGSVWTDSYDREIERLAKAAGISSRVQILPMLTQNELIAKYHESDVCFFTSYQNIGFSRTPLEAMACGCVVISYGNEGSDEIIRNGETGFLVDPGDIPQAADIIERLITQPEQVRQITRAARQQVESNHSLKKYVDTIELRLREIMTETTHA